MKKNSVTDLLKALIKEEVDRALELSNKRRKDFKKNFKLKEAENMGQQNKTNVDDPQNQVQQNSSGLSGTTGTQGTSSPTSNNPIAPVDNSQQQQQQQQQPGGIDLGAMSQNADSGVENTPTDDTTTEPKDPMEDITNTAKELAKTTRDIPTIVKAVKSKLQDNYEQLQAMQKGPKDIVKALADTKDVMLVNAAKRLEQFLAGKTNEN